MVNRRHGLDGIGSRAGESKLAVDHFAPIQREGPKAEDDETAVTELAIFVFVEVEDDFLVTKVVFYNFHDE